MRARQKPLARAHDATSARVGTGQYGVRHSTKPPNGFEPLTCGLQNRGASTINPCQEPTCEQLLMQIVGALWEPPVVEEFAAVLASWPDLPEHIRKAIVTLVKSV